MEELLELKNLLLTGSTAEALALVEELEEMSRDDKISNIVNYGKVLLLHLIKRQVESRSTRSWDISIHNAVLGIQTKNKRRKTGGFYLKPEELRQALEEAYLPALNAASLEVEGGRYEVKDLAQRVDRDRLLDEALKLVLQ